MTVRLEELLAALAHEPTAERPLEEVLAWARARQQAEKLAPDAVRLLIDMGKAFRRHQAMGYSPGEDVQMRRELEDLLARLDRLGNTT